MFTMFSNIYNFISGLFVSEKQPLTTPIKKKTKDMDSRVIKFVLTSFYDRNTTVKLETLKTDMINCVNECKDMTLISSNVLEKDGKNRNSCTDCYFQIECTAKSLLKTRPDLEGHFAVCKNWTEDQHLFDKYNFIETHRPWLSIEDDNYFFRMCRSAHDNVGMKKVSFGTLVHPSHIEIHSSKESGNTRYPLIVANFYHDSRLAEINFKMDSTKIEIQYSSIRRIFMSGTERALQMYLEVKNPPFAFSTVPPNAQLKPIQQQQGGKGRGTVRKSTSQNSQFKERILTPWPNVIELEKALFLKDVFGKSNIIKLEFDVDRNVGYQIASRLHFRCDKIPVHWVLMNESSRFSDSSEFISNIKIYTDNYFTQDHSLSFECAYLINALLERNFVLRLQIGSDQIDRFYRDLETMHNQNKRCLETSLTKCIYLLYDGTILNYRGAIYNLFKYYSSDESKMDVLKKPRNTEFIRRVVLTPTQTIFFPPEVIFTNRVLRMVQPDYALKVSFRDENLQTLSIPFFCSNQIHDFAIKIPMTAGLTVAGCRKYQLLGWSNSQLHDHSVWMYAEDNDGETVGSIRKLMGDFSQIKTVSKYMARMGQCFTSTEETVLVPNTSKYVKVEDDIYGGGEDRGDSKAKKNYCFSDGVGKISESLLRKICVKLNLEENISPCALQIRYAGFKGMLVLDKNLYNDYIVFRKSMKKFECPETENSYLEVVKYSKPTPVYLNRPLIMILDQLGVPYEVFAKLQDKMMKKATIMLLDEEKAAQYLHSKCQLPNLKYQDLAEAGTGLTSEPFFRAMLLISHKNFIAKIRSKCSYEIDMSLGRTMFGVLDETGTLEYGQVFVQFSTINLETKKRTVQKLIGKVMVTKNPCMSLGDVRMLKAVDVPALNHIVDCIVFPQKGPRPHPNEMAGSDLDGDEYAVIWDKDLYFARNRAPSNFPEAQGRPMTQNITEEDIVDFLVQYIKRDIVGKVATAHLAFADFKGINSTVCSSLAQKYSLAVDFAKSGQIKKMEISEKPKYYPDFMEKSGRTYKSHQVLGYLYRACCQFEKINAQYSFAYQNINIDPEFIYQGWEDYEESALHALKRYNARLSSLLSWYGIKSEIEAITGNITGSKDQRHNELYTTRQLVSRFIEELWSDFFEEFEMEFQEDESENDLTSSIKLLNLNSQQTLYPQKKLQKASAWYVVTYRNPNSTCLSFPWIVSKYLSAIKKCNQRNCPIENPLIQRLNAKLRSNFVVSQLPVGLNGYLEMLELSCRNFVVTMDDVKLSFQVLFKWALTQRLFEPGMFFDNHKKFYEMFVAFMKRNEENTQIQNPMSLILEFFSSCSYLPYECDTTQRADKLYDKQLLLSATNHFGIRCMQAFHSISVSNNMEECGIFLNANENKILLEMEPIRIPIEFIAAGHSLGYIKEKIALEKLSGVEEVQIRIIPEEKVALISAVGTINAIRFLDDHLNNEIDKLEEEVF